MPFYEIGDFPLNLVSFCLKGFTFTTNDFKQSVIFIFTNRAKIFLLAPIVRTF